MNKKQRQFNEYDALLEGGEEAAAEGDAAGSKKASSKKEESKKKTESKKESSKKEDKKQEDEDDDPWSPPVKEPCCCCICVCASEFVQDLSCCGCFPIRCGMVSIGIFTIAITTILFCWYFFLFLNEYLHWWYVLVCLFLLCPLLVASNFVVSWFVKDTRTTRALMMTSQILSLVSVVLVAIWNLIYFVFIYKKDSFYAGMGDIPTNTYTKQSKKTWIFTMLAETVILMCFFAYFICVTTAYWNGMAGPEEDAAAAPEPEAEKEESKKASSKKPSEKPEGDGEAAAE